MEMIGSSSRSYSAGMLFGFTPARVIIGMCIAVLRTDLISLYAQHISHVQLQVHGSIVEYVVNSWQVFVALWQLQEIIHWVLVDQDLPSRNNLL